MNFMSDVDKKSETANRLGRRVPRAALMLSVPLLLLAGGLWFWLTSGATVSTENAQVVSHIVNVAPEVGGRIVSVHTRENIRVNAGDLLYRIDPEPYRIALLEAQAAAGNARLHVAEMRGSYSSKVADVASRGSDVELASENFRRQKELLGQGFTTRAQYDQAVAKFAAAKADRDAAIAEADAAHAKLGTGSVDTHPEVAAANAAVAKAALDLKRTVIRAPIAGIVAQADGLNPGALAIPMISNVSIVGGGEPWIEANFKETQLVKIRPGQRAEIEIDAIPGKTFHAHVTGIGAGTGAEFSILPPQNATGNWVKVTQRVPVRLAFDDKPARLVSGWSAHVTVHVR